MAISRKGSKEKDLIVTRATMFEGKPVFPGKRIKTTSKILLACNKAKEYEEGDEKKYKFVPSAERHKKAMAKLEASVTNNVSGASAVDMDALMKTMMEQVGAIAKEMFQALVSEAEAADKAAEAEAAALEEANKGKNK